MPCLFVKRPYRYCNLSNLLSHGAPSLGIKLPALEAGQFRLYSAENENKCNCNSTPVYLYTGCPTRYLTRHFFHNSNINEEVTGEWRKLHNEELNNLYSSPNIVRVLKSRRMRWAGHVARMGERRSVYRVLVGKPEGRRPLGRPRHRWGDNIRMDLREVGCGCVDWMELAQDRDRWRALVSAVMNLRVP